MADRTSAIQRLQELMSGDPPLGGSFRLGTFARHTMLQAKSMKPRAEVIRPESGPKEEAATRRLAGSNVFHPVDRIRDLSVGPVVSRPLADRVITYSADAQEVVMLVRNDMVVDRHRLIRGAVVSVAFLVVAAGSSELYRVVALDPHEGGNVGNGVVFLFVVGIGLAVGSYVSLRRSRANLFAQGLAALLLNWLVTCILFAIPLGLYIDGDLGGFLVLTLMISPVFWALQLVGEVAAAIVNRVAQRRGGNSG